MKIAEIGNKYPPRWVQISWIWIWICPQIQKWSSVSISVVPVGEAEGGEAESGADSEARTMANAMMIGVSVYEHKSTR